MKKTLQYVACTALVAMSTTAFGQQSGDVDLTFGTNGWTLTDHYAGVGELYHDMITLSNDKIVMVGSVDNVSRDILVTRFKPDGVPDSTFGMNGAISIDASLGLDEDGYSVHELSNGQLLITGFITTMSSYDGFIMQLNEDGSVDDTFGTTASGRTNFNAGDNTICLGTAIRTVGTDIYVAGSALSGGQADMCVFKFTQSGALNTSFASNGVATADIDGENDETYAFEIASNGEMFLAGISDYMGDQRGAVVKLSSFGTPTTFGAGNGYYVFDLGSGFNEVNDLVLDNNGKILLFGDAGTAPDIDGIVMRLNADGSVDNTFSGDGMQNSDPGASTAMFFTRGFQTTDGNILATGFLNGASTRQLYAFKMDGTGSPDGSFNGNGDVYHDFSISINTLDGRCAALQSDGNIILGGTIESQDFVGSNMFMVRLYGSDPNAGIDEQTATSFGVFPNPATATFRIDPTVSVERVELINLAGQVMNTWEASPVYSINAAVSPGTYLLRVTTSGNEVITTRLSVTH